MIKFNFFSSFSAYLAKNGKDGRFPAVLVAALADYLRDAEGRGGCDAFGLPLADTARGQNARADLRYILDQLATDADAASVRPSPVWATEALEAAEKASRAGRGTLAQLDALGSVLRDCPPGRGGKGPWAEACASLAQAASSLAGSLLAETDAASWD